MGLATHNRLDKPCPLCWQQMVFKPIYLDVGRMPGIYECFICKTEVPLGYFQLDPWPWVEDDVTLINGKWSPNYEVRRGDLGSSIWLDHSLR